MQGNDLGENDEDGGTEGSGWSCEVLASDLSLTPPAWSLWRRQSTSLALRFLMNKN